MLAALICLSAGSLKSAHAQSLPVDSLPYIETIQPEWGLINDLAFSPDEQTLVVAAQSGLWLLDADLHITHQLQGHTGPVYSASWNSDGSLLATGGEDYTIRIWDMAETSPTYLNTLTTLRDSGPVYFVAWSPDDAQDQIAAKTVTLRQQSSSSMFVQSEVHVWDVSSGRLERAFGSLSYTASELAWSPDGLYLAGAGMIVNEGYTLLVWDAQDGSVAARSEGRIDQIRSVAWRPDSDVIARADVTGVIELFDARPSYPVGLLGYYDTPQYNGWGMNALSWSPDGAYLAAGTELGTVLVYDANTAQLIVYADSGPHRIRGVHWRGDGLAIAVQLGNHGIRVFDLRELPAYPPGPTMTPYPTQEVLSLRSHGEN